MSAEAPSIEAQVYDQLAERAHKHFGDSALSAIVRVGEYDPERPTHDFDNVFFEANPSLLTPALFRVLATGLSGKSPRAVTEGVVRPFEPQVEDIAARAEERKLMVVTGHQTLFEPAFAVYGVQRAVAGHTDRSYADMARSTHLIVSRALTTVDVFGRWPLTSVGQQLANFYYTFPASPNYRGDGSIPLEFQRANNARMLDQFAENTAEPGTIGVMSASGTTEKKNDEGVFVIPRVKGDENHGTMSVLLQGWDILPVGGIYKHGLVAELGEIIPAEEVTPDAIHGMMKDVIAESRTKRGVPTVYAEA